MPQVPSVLLQNAGFHSLAWLNNIPLYISCIYTYVWHFLYLFIHWWTHGLCPRPQFVINAEMNIGVQISLQNSDFISFAYTTRREIAHLYSISIFIFLRKFQIFSIVTVGIYIHTNSAQCSLFYTASSTLVVCCLFENNHSSRCEVISHCSFDFISLMMSDYEHLLMYLLTIFMSSLEKYLFRSFDNFHIVLLVSLLLSCKSFLYTVDINPFSLPIILFAVPKIFRLMSSHLLSFTFVVCTFDVISKKIIVKTSFLGLFSLYFLLVVLYLVSCI